MLPRAASNELRVRAHHGCLGSTSSSLHSGESVGCARLVPRAISSVASLWPPPRLDGSSTLRDCTTGCCRAAGGAAGMLIVPGVALLLDSPSSSRSSSRWAVPQQSLPCHYSVASWLDPASCQDTKLSHCDCTLFHKGVLTRVGWRCKRAHPATPPAAFCSSCDRHMPPPALRHSASAGRCELACTRHASAVCRHWRLYCACAKRAQVSTNTACPDLTQTCFSKHASGCLLVQIASDLPFESCRIRAQLVLVLQHCHGHSLLQPRAPVQRRRALSVVLLKVSAACAWAARAIKRGVILGRSLPVGAPLVGRLLQLQGAP